MGEGADSVQADGQLALRAPALRGVAQSIDRGQPSCGRRLLDQALVIGRVGHELEARVTQARHEADE